MPKVEACLRATRVCVHEALSGGANVELGKVGAAPGDGERAERLATHADAGHQQPLQPRAGAQQVQPPDVAHLAPTQRKATQGNAKLT